LYEEEFHPDQPGAPPPANDEEEGEETTDVTMVISNDTHMGRNNISTLGIRKNN
jgi:hypothetical protein